jgi:hypothetical protein
VAEVRKRGDDFWHEFEFYLSDLIVGIVLDVALVSLMAPVAVLGGVSKAAQATGEPCPCPCPCKAPVHSVAAARAVTAASVLSCMHNAHPSWPGSLCHLQERRPPSFLTLLQAPAALTPSPGWPPQRFTALEGTGGVLTLLLGPSLLQALCRGGWRGCPARCSRRQPPA